MIPPDTATIIEFDPHVLAAILCLIFVPLVYGAGWLFDECRKSF
jgi:hypothetical protein